MKKTPQINL